MLLLCENDANNKISWILVAGQALSRGRSVSDVEERKKGKGKKKEEDLIGWYRIWVNVTDPAVVPGFQHMLVMASPPNLKDRTRVFADMSMRYTRFVMTPGKKRERETKQNNKHKLNTLWHIQKHTRTQVACCQTQSEHRYFCFLFYNSKNVSKSHRLWVRTKLDSKYETRRKSTRTL